MFMRTLLNLLRPKCFDDFIIKQARIVEYYRLEVTEGLLLGLVQHI